MYHIFLKNTKSLLYAALLFLIGCPSGAVAQNQKRIDSLESIVEISPPDSQVKALLALTLEVLDQDIQRSYQYADRAFEIAYRTGDSIQLVTAGRIKGQLLRRLDRLDESLTVLNLVRPIAKRSLANLPEGAEKNKLMIDYKRILNALAIGYTYKAAYDEALKYNFESLVIREAEGDKKEISIALNNIGLVYFKLGNVQLALDYYTRSLQLKKESTDPNFDLDVLLVNMGLCYISLEKYTEARKYFAQAFEVCGGKCSDFMRMEGKFGEGLALYKMGEYEKAVSNFNESLQLATAAGDQRFQMESLLHLGMVSKDMNEPGKSEEFLKKAEALAIGARYNQLLINIYKTFSELYLKARRFEDASVYQHRYITLKDSIIGEKLIQNIADVQAKYEERENLKTIAAKDAVLALKEETLRRQRTENIFYATAAVLVFALAVLMLLLFRLTRRANERLEERVDIRTKELNDTNDALMKVNGEMDNFIYKTSHDIRGPLASLKGICNVAIMDIHDPSALGYLKKLDQTADKLNGILTRLLIINQINHATLAPNVINFEEIIEEILYQERKKGVPKRLDITYEIEKGFVMKSDKEMVRIVMENLIDNSIKFSNDSDRVQPFVRIHVGAMGKNVIISVTDNGVGINDETKEQIFHMFVRASERSETGGIGLYLTKLATERLEGTIDFANSEEKYTVFTVALPLDLTVILESRQEQERIREFERTKSEKQKSIPAP